MVMPYFGSTYGGKIFEQVGLRFNGAELTLEEFVRAGERLRTTLLELGEYRASSRKPSRAARAEPPGKAPREAFSDGPPCLQILSREKTGSGGNNLLIMMGCYYKKAFPNEWEQKIEEANVLYCLPPRGSDEIQSMIRSLRKKEYNYTCQTEPMRSSCNSKACRNRRYGVGAWGGYPDISGLTVLKTEPVVWFVDVDGERIEIGSDDLQMYSKFHKVCLEKLNRCYKTMKQDTWLKMVNAAMEHVCVVDPPEDGAPGARIMELIEEWLTNRRKGTRREDLLTGRPWQNDAVDGRYEFRLKDLQKFVDASGEREMTRPRLIRILQRNGGDTGFYAVSGKGVNFWWLPRWAVEGDPEVSVRKLPEEEN
jgi:hypothetical protein